MLCRKEECCGCSACFAACPLHCISMQRNVEGFLFPVIDEAVCVGCNACVKACPHTAENDTGEEKNVKAYAAICREQNGAIRRQSSSGGLFWCFAQAVLKKGGVVVGVKMSEDGAFVYHSAVENERELVQLLGSKYVQSDKKDVFRSVKDYLQGGRTVLFSGTPCEVAGLVNYIPTPLREKLYTVDLICHGVPSPMVWEKYLLEQNMVVRGVSFRDKTFGWKEFSVLIQGEEKDLSEKVGDNLYMRGFLDHLYLRESCHNCRYKGLERVADITLGDFWRVQDFLPEYDDNQGTSLLFVYSKKGKELFHAVKEMYEIDSCEVDARLAAESNPMMLQSSKPHTRRKKFFEDVNKKTVSRNVNDCTKKSVSYRLIRKIKQLLMKYFKGGN